MTSQEGHHLREASETALFLILLPVLNGQLGKAKGVKGNRYHQTHGQHGHV